MNLVISVVGFVISGIGLVQALLSRFSEKKTRNFFIAIFGVLLVYIQFNLMGQVANNHYGPGWAAYYSTTLFLESLSASVLTVMITGFVLYQSKENDWIRKPAFIISVVIEFIYIVFLIVTQFTGVFYYIDNNNDYSRGTYYPVLLIPPVLIMFINLITVIVKWKKLSVNQRIAFLIYSIVPMIFMIIQMIFYGIYFSVLGATIATIFMFAFLLSDQTERYYQEQLEKAQLEIDIMLAQIQPHFLYNSLTTIKHLCRKDPETAERAVTDFTEYLRHNMDSLSVDKPIPFEKEIEHVKQYISLQKLRFGDELGVRWELECTDFEIPTLTLQPLVENAITYGVRRSDSGMGVVTIRSQRHSDRIEVQVIDDGPGFVANSLPDDEERSHTGIQNVSERLKRVSDGELVIDSVVGKGTTATIVLPL